MMNNGTCLAGIHSFALQGSGTYVIHQMCVLVKPHHITFGLATQVGIQFPIKCSGYNPVLDQIRHHATTYHAHLVLTMRGVVALMLKSHVNCHAAELSQPTCYCY